MAYPPWLIATNRLSSWAVLRTDAITPGDMPLSYLVSSDQPTDRCRFTQVATPNTFDIDLGDAMTAQDVASWRVLALLYSNAGASGIATITGASSGSTIATPTYTLPGPLALWANSDYKDFARVHTLLFEPAGRTESYLRVAITDTAPRRVANTASGFTTAGYFELGNLLVAGGDDCITPLDTSGAPIDINLKGGSYVEGREEEMRQTIAEGGPTFPRQRPGSQVRTFTLHFSDLNNPTRANIEYARNLYYRTIGRLRRWAGQHRPVLFCENIDATTYRMERTVYGLIVGLNDVSIAQQNYFEVVIKIREML